MIVILETERSASVGVCFRVLTNTAQQAYYVRFETTKLVDTLLIPWNHLSDAFKNVMGIIILKYLGKYCVLLVAIAILEIVHFGVLATQSLSNSAMVVPFKREQYQRGYWRYLKQYYDRVLQRYYRNIGGEFTYDCLRYLPAQELRIPALSFDLKIGWEWSDRWMVDRWSVLIICARSLNQYEYLFW